MLCILEWLDLWTRWNDTVSSDHCGRGFMCWSLVRYLSSLDSKGETVISMTVGKETHSNHAPNGFCSVVLWLGWLQVGMQGRGSSLAKPLRYRLGRFGNDEMVSRI